MEKKLIYSCSIHLDVGFLMCPDVKPPLVSSEPVVSEGGARAAENSSPLSAPDSGPVLKRHRAREHKKVYACPRCNKVFQNSSNLNRHIRSHGIAVAVMASSPDSSIQKE